MQVVSASREPARPTSSPATCSTPPRSRPASQAAQPDLVVNAAGAASVGRSWERPAETFAINATGVLNLLEAVAETRRRRTCSASPRPTSTASAGEEELPLARGAGAAAGHPLRRQQGGDGDALRPVRARARPADRGGPCLQPDRPRPVAAVRRPRLRPPHRRGRARGRDGGRAGARQPGAPSATSVDVRDGARALLGALAAGALPAPTTSARAGRRRSPRWSRSWRRRRRSRSTVRHDPGLERPADPPALVGDPAPPARGDRLRARDSR